MKRARASASGEWSAMHDVAGPRRDAPGRSRTSGHQALQHRGRDLRLPGLGAQDVEGHHVARALPDRVDRRLPVEPGQGALLDIAVAAEALHRLVEQARRGLADAEFRRRRHEPGVGRLLGVGRAAGRSCGRAAWPGPSWPRSRAPGRPARCAWRLVDELLLEHAAVPGMVHGVRQPHPHQPGRSDGAVEPGQLHHLDDGAHARALPRRSARRRHPRTRPRRRRWSGCRACPSAAAGEAR